MNPRSQLEPDPLAGLELHRGAQEDTRLRHVDREAGVRLRVPAAPEPDFGPARRPLGGPSRHLRGLYLGVPVNQRV
jgi:hypothetical protein